MTKNLGNSDLTKHFSTSFHIAFQFSRFKFSTQINKSHDFTSSANDARNYIIRFTKSFHKSIIRNKIEFFLLSTEASIENNFWMQFFTLKSWEKLSEIRWDFNKCIKDVETRFPYTFAQTQPSSPSSLSRSFNLSSFFNIKNR